MILIGLIVLAQVAALPHGGRTYPFEIGSNKPFVHVSLDGSAPQWFILDTGNRGNTLIARECADRLGLEHGADERADLGAGSGADVRTSTGSGSVVLTVLGDTVSVANPLLVTLDHVSAAEGRRLDGSLGADFISRHVIEIDYARRRITMHDTDDYAPPRGAIVIPIHLDTGWAVVDGSITPRGGAPIPCHLIVDTGVRFTVAMFRPFCERHRLYDEGAQLHDAVIGAGVSGLSRGDVVRVGALTLGAVSFPQAVAIMSRDTSGVFAVDGPDGIVGGEILRRYRTTFDYPHHRMILEPYGSSPEFEWDMSGLFLGTEPPEFRRVRIVAVNPQAPASEAGLQSGDEIVSIDGRRAASLTIDDVRAMLRKPVSRRLEIRRDDKLLRVTLRARRLV
jgi:PDZ domain/Aspartyl protease